MGLSLGYALVIVAAFVVASAVVAAIGNPYVALAFLAGAAVVAFVAVRYRRHARI